MAKILIVDDEASIRNTLKEILEFEKYDVDEAMDGIQCLGKLKKSKYDVVIMDIKMPKMDGMEALERVQTISSDTPVIMISGHANIDTAVDAVKKGAFDFISKPPDLNRLLITVRNAMDKSSLITDNKVLKRRVHKVKSQEIIGESEPILKIKETIDRVAPTDARVLINGSNGTGKELVARWLHSKSGRTDGPIIEVNCAAIPSELIESELFGHEKGAFTGAQAQRIGRFEQAQGGTLFLDEVGDMHPELQTRLLRVLSSQEFYRVGGHRPIKSDVRIIAATNQYIEELIKTNKFREDLYHRLNVFKLVLPPLRERKEDISSLITYFLKTSATELNTEEKRIDDSTLKYLVEFNWPGNIRQLENICRYLTVMSASSVITIDDLPDDIFQNTQKINVVSTDGDWKSDLQQHIRKEILSDKDILKKVGVEVEKMLIEESLLATDGIKLEAAKLLGWGRNTLARKVKDH